MEADLLSLFSSVPFIASFLAGVLSFLSPCVLPLVPAYLSYISGISLSELRGEVEMSAFHRQKILVSSLMFILGFGVVFVLLGASLANLIENIFTNKWFRIVGGAIIILFGLHIMGVFKVKFFKLSNKG